MSMPVDKALNHKREKESERERERERSVNCKETKALPSKK